MEIDLTGRSAIVTGGSKGLGLATAQRFAASGADVAIIARGREALDDAIKAIKASAKARVVAIQGDVTVAADIARAFEEAAKTFGKVDIAVNNAGVTRRSAFESLTDDMLQGDLDQKLFAAVRLSRLAWPGMKERRWGRIINVLNIGAKAPRPGSAPTSISRAAGLALTKVMSHEGGPHNILVNALLVGLIDSDQHVRAAARAGKPYEEFIASRAEEIPLRRFGRAEEFANLACFLVSDAGSYITGTAVNVDGGRSPVV